MNRAKRTRAILVGCAIPLLFVGALAWIIYTQRHQDALNRALIQEIKKQVENPSGFQTIIGPAAPKPPIHLTADRLKLLLSEGADPNAHDETGITPLSFWDHLRMLLHLQKATQPAGPPAIVLAMEADNPEMVKALLEKGANPNIRFHLRFHNALFNSVTPLEWSTRWTDPTITQMLLAKGANVKGSEGIAAIFGALMNGNLRTLKILLDCGADVNGIPSDTFPLGPLGFTPLMLATLLPNQPATTVKLLLDHHADVNIKDKHGRSALLLARHQLLDRTTSEKRELAEIIRLLKQYGAKE